MLLHWSAHHTVLALASATASIWLSGLLGTTLVWSFIVAHLLATLRSSWSLLLHQHWHALNQKLEVVLELFLVG